MIDPGQSNHGSRRLWLWGLLLIIVGGAAIRLSVAAQRPVWADELLTWRDARESTLTDFALWRHSKQHTPLSYMLVRVSLDSFGHHSAWALRLPALLAGIACIPAGFLVGRAVHSRGVGMAMAALVAVDPSMINQSAQARMYTLLALFTLLALAWSVGLFAAPRRRPLAWCGLGALLAAATWSNYAGGMVIIGMALAAVVLFVIDVRDSQARKESIGRLIGVGIAITTVIVLCLPGSIKLLGIQPESDSNVTVDPSVVLHELYRQTKALIDLKAVTFIVLAVAVVGLVGLWRRSKTTAAIFTAIALVTLAMQFPFRSTHRFLMARYLLPLQPTIWIGLAMTPAITRGGWKRLLLGGLTCYVLVQGWRGFHLESDWHVEPARYALAAAIEYVAEHRGADEAILITPYPKVQRATAFYELPINGELSRRLSRAISDGDRDVRAIVAELDAETTWIIGRVDKPSRGWPDEVRATIETVADRYGVALDAAELDEAIATRFMLVVRIDNAEVRYWSPSDLPGE